MSDAWGLILKGRAILASGGSLHSKGSQAIPSRLRQVFLQPIDATIPIKLTTKAAKEADPEDVVVEHLVPMKRVAIEIIDPTAHDPRTGGKNADVVGPAIDIKHAEEIARKLITKALVTKEEHAKLNLAHPSFQWDAPAGDGLARYQAAGIELFAL